MLLSSSIIISSVNSGSHRTNISHPEPSKYNSLCHNGTKYNLLSTYNLYILLLNKSLIVGFSL
jgi:hypothetical protein